MENPLHPSFPVDREHKNGKKNISNLNFEQHNTKPNPRIKSKTKRDIFESAIKLQNIRDSKSIRRQT